MKIDPENVAEDELFPASLFEAKPPTSDLGAPTSDLGAPTSDLGAPTSDLGAPTSDLGAPTSDLGDTSNIGTISYIIDKSTKESRETSEHTIANGIHKSLIQDSDSIQRENADKMIMIQGSASIERENADKMKIMIQDSDILQEKEDQTKNKSADMEAFPDRIVKENQGDEEVFEGIQDGVVPDVVETRSGSSVSSLPDIVENTDEMVAEERPKSVSPKVPDLVKDYQNLDFVS